MPLFPTDGLIFKQMIAPIASTNGTAVSTAVDCQGAKHLCIVVGLGVLASDYTALKLQESNTLTNATTLASGTDISGADYTVSPATIPLSTSDGLIWGFSVPITGGRKRYVNLVATTTATNDIAFALAILSMRDEIQWSAAIRGFSQELVVAG